MRFWLAVSILGVVLTLVILPIRGLNYGVDFLGGTLILAEFPEHRDIGEYRAVLDGLGLGERGGDRGLRRIGRAGGADARRQPGEDAGEGAAPVADQVQAALDAAFPGVKSTCRSTSVGGKVSDELVTTGIIAVGLALLAIMIYVWLRFEWQFAVGAVISLLHDVIVMVGVFSLLQLQFDLTIVAALLTIIGFSINDTVVVFDRVRENLRKYKKMPLRDVMNLSLNETLSRTMMTVFTVLIALVALLFFGGPVAFGFAFAVIFGLIVGTYSSIWVASAIVLLARRQARLGSEVGRGRDAVRQGRGLMRTTEVDFEGRLPVDSYGAGRLPGGRRGAPRAAGAAAGGRRRLGRAARPRAVPGTGGGASTFCWSGPARTSRRSGAGLRARRARGSRRRARGSTSWRRRRRRRTYNVLLAEGRRVAAALMPV